MIKIQHFHYILQQSNLLLEKILVENDDTATKKLSPNNCALLHTLQEINMRIFNKTNRNANKADKEIFSHIDFTCAIMRLLEKYYKAGKTKISYTPHILILLDALIWLNNHYTLNQKYAYAPYQAHL